MYLLSLAACRSNACIIVLPELTFVLHEGLVTQWNIIDRIAEIWNKTKRSGCFYIFLLKFALKHKMWHLTLKYHWRILQWPTPWCSHYHVGDDFSVICTLKLQCETWVSAVLARILLTLFFARNATQNVWNSWKQRVVIHCDWVTYSLFDWYLRCTLAIKYLVLSVMAGLIAEMLFMLFFI